jgi:hypothetical protein
MDDVTGGWGNIRNEGLHNLYSSPDVTMVMKLRQMTWAGHVARMGMRQNVGWRA